MEGSLGSSTVTKTFHSERNMQPLEGLSRQALYSDLGFRRRTPAAYVENRGSGALVKAERVVRRLLLKSK